MEFIVTAHILFPYYSNWSCAVEAELRVLKTTPGSAPYALSTNKFTFVESSVYLTRF